MAGISRSSQRRLIRELKQLRDAYAALQTTDGATPPSAIGIPRALYQARWIQWARTQEVPEDRIALVLDALKYEIKNRTDAGSHPEIDEVLSGC